jgi:2-polyprenyl-6-hydroxyphenyl methylase/3-demethylubiquinone-9 3-methyltransferase
MPAENRVAFGDNWASYARLVGEAQIEDARQGLLKLLPAAVFEGRSFLDIGCGSGLHALAAARLGVRHVLAIDLDQNSIATTEALLARHAGAVPWTVRRADVFDLQPRQYGRYDIVYSWGVLHQTGDVAEALGKAAALVAPGGHFAFALYRPTRLDRLWVAEKRWYAKARPGPQRLARALYVGLLRIRLALTGRSLKGYVATYKTRGTDFGRDVHAWLGGYPYQTIGAAEVEDLMRRQGLEKVQELAISRSATPLGAFGSGCDQYVYRRPA